MPSRRTLDDRYEIRESLGSGGMAEVYLARDLVLDRDVAIKILSRCHAQDEDFVRRFRREAQNAASLAHPNVVSVYDLGEAPESPGEPPTYYIAMEYVDGVSLRGLLERHEGKLPILPVAEAVGIARQAALGLGAAHAQGLIHRDVKPTNILIPAPNSGDGESLGGRVKVADLGIARLSEVASSTGDLLGSAHYVSPEQAMGGEATLQSDLYSLGIVLYEMITGRRPYDSADHPYEAAMQHVTGDLTPPNRIVPDLPEELNATVVRLLGKDPEERHRDADELVSDLDAISQTKETPVTSGEPPVKPRGIARNAVLIPLCALMMLTATLWSVQQGFGLAALRGLGDLIPVEVRDGVDRLFGGDEDDEDDEGYGEDGDSPGSDTKNETENSEAASESGDHPAVPEPRDAFSERPAAENPLPESPVSERPASEGSGSKDSRSYTPEPGESSSGQTGGDGGAGNGSGAVEDSPRSSKLRGEKNETPGVSGEAVPSRVLGGGEAPVEAADEGRVSGGGNSAGEGEPPPQETNTGSALGGGTSGITGGPDEPDRGGEDGGISENAGNGGIGEPNDSSAPGEDQYAGG